MQENGTRQTNGKLDQTIFSIAQSILSSARTFRGRTKNVFCTTGSPVFAQYLRPADIRTRFRTGCSRFREVRGRGELRAAWQRNSAKQAYVRHTEHQADQNQSVLSCRGGGDWASEYTKRSCVAVATGTGRPNTSNCAVVPMNASTQGRGRCCATTGTHRCDRSSNSQRSGTANASPTRRFNRRTYGRHITERRCCAADRAGQRPAYGCDCATTTLAAGQRLCLRRRTERAATRERAA